MHTLVVNRTRTPTVCYGVLRTTTLLVHTVNKKNEKLCATLLAGVGPACSADVVALLLE